jgi:hypothetical protein
MEREASVPDRPNQIVVKQICDAPKTVPYALKRRQRCGIDISHDDYKRVVQGDGWLFSQYPIMYGQSSMPKSIA